MRIRPPTEGPTLPDSNLPASPAATLAVPRILHLGSGKSFREQWLNVDCDPGWHPDIVADLNEPFPARTEYGTDRFGIVRLEPGGFEAIVAQDVLEHLTGLTTCMKSCLDLLEVGGLFHIGVPYDLSCGAWQDPTHVRAFNEQSWRYYTDWCWYLGWGRVPLRAAPPGLRAERLRPGARRPGPERRSHRPHPTRRRRHEGGAGQAAGLTRPARGLRAAP